MARRPAAPRSADAYLREFDRFHERHAWQRLDPVDAVYAISDLHSDSKANSQWLRELPPRLNGALLIAGDVSHNPSEVAAVVDMMVAKFRHVFFCVGNHELWDTRGYADSIEKLLNLLELAHAHGAHVAPALLGDAPDGVAIVPMASWYHSHFVSPGDGAAGVREAALMDSAVSWPSGLSDAHAEDISMRRCAFFAAMNTRTLADVAPPSDAAAAQQRFFGREPPAPLLRGWPVVSFSHFLPHPELHRGYRWLQHFEGSSILGEQLAALHAGTASATHVFGHTHFSIDITIENVRYVQHPLGNPHERTNGWQIHTSAQPHGTHALATVWSRTSESAPQQYQATVTRQQYPMTVPAGMHAGMALETEVDGQRYRVPIPAGVGPGMAFLFEI